MAGTLGWNSYIVISITYVPSLGLEICYEKKNGSTDHRKLHCAGSCCGVTEYKKYCCGPSPLEKNDNETSLESSSMSEKAVGTIVGGVIVFLAVVGAVVACCFCKPSCIPDNKVGPHQAAVFNKGLTRNVTIHNSSFTPGVLNPGYMTSVTHGTVSYPAHSLPEP